MSESQSSSSNGRKRTRPSFLADDSTPSDPALFSSDPPDPSADNYFAPKRKKQYRGTWWQNGSSEKRERKAFARNMDSGVFMGSDSSVESLDVEDDPRSDDTVPDDILALQSRSARREPAITPRKVRISEPSNVIEARRRIAFFAGDANEDHELESHPGNDNTSQRHSRISADILDLSERNLPYLTDDMLAPLLQMIKQPRWNPRPRVEPSIFNSRGHSPEHSQYSLDSDDDLDELRRPFSLSLDHNALTQLPPSLFRLHDLTYLEVCGNNLSSISPNIRNLQHLLELHVTRNHLRWLPGEIVDLMIHQETGKLATVCVHSNPLLQPFSYIGLRSLIGGDEYHITQIIPDTITAVQERLIRLEEDASSSKGCGQVRSLVETQILWLSHMYKYFVAYPEEIWMNADPDEVNLPQWERLAIIKKWGAKGHEGDEHDLQRARRDMHLKTASCRTIRMAATPVCYLDICGKPIKATNTLVEELPKDETILPARLLALSDMRHDRLAGQQPANVTSTMLATRSTVRSLFALSLVSASRVPELHQLPSLLPEDAPNSVRRGLDHAIEARREGGRTCYACKRSYIIPRAEWVEYHILSTDGSHYSKNDLNGFADLFVPFLRKVCSWGCVPHFNFADELPA